MIGTHPKSIEAFRTATASRPEYVHKRRICPCGCNKTATVQELQRYGMREKCRAGK